MFAALGSSVPFDYRFPRSYSAPTVRAYAPAQSGVYGISNAAEWIYIGETDDIQSALLNHLREVDSALTQRQPTGFVYEVCDRGRRPARQDCLILEYEPTCNRHWAKHRR